MSELLRKIFRIKIDELDDHEVLPIPYHLTRERKEKNMVFVAHRNVHVVLRRYYDYQIEHFGNYEMALAYAHLGDLPEELLAALHELYLLTDK